MEPLNRTLLIVAANHLPIGHLFAEAVGGLVGVDGELHRRCFSLLAWPWSASSSWLTWTFSHGAAVEALLQVFQGSIGTSVTALAVALTSGSPRRRAFGHNVCGGAGRVVPHLLHRSLCFRRLQETRRVCLDLTRAVFNHLHHLCDHMDLLISQLLTADERPLQLNLQSLALPTVSLLFVLFIDLIHLLEDL